MRTITIDYRPTEKQKMFHATDANEVLYGGAAGGGKELRIDTPIPTPNGFVAIGELKVGDYVFGLDGKPHKVLMCSPIREHIGYRFIFDDASEVVCNDEHLWFTYTAADMLRLHRRTDEFRANRREERASRATGKKGKVVTEAITSRNKKYPTKISDDPIGSVKTAREIVDTLYAKGGRSNHAIPVAQPLDLPERVLPIDPYLLGIWLGDGTASSGTFTSADGLAHAFEERGFKVGKLKPKYLYRIYGLITVLGEMGLVNNKHIPFEYLWASKEQRLALLQGLMDTDGNCNKNGTAEFTNTNKQLVDGAAFLVRSLGMKCTVTSGISKLNGKECGKKYRIKFTPKIPVFRLERKLERQKHEFRTTTNYRYLVRVERVEPTKMRCITIDSEDHLYLASENLVPTHNSFAIVMDAFMRCCTWQGTKAAIFRRTFPELESTVIATALRVYPKELYKYNKAKHEMTLFNGSIIRFCHCSTIGDMYNYQGEEITFLYVDELTHFEKEIYDYLRTRNRAPVELGVKPIIRCTSNPGGIGHGWVKALFVDPAPYGEKVNHVITLETGESKTVTTQYIPSLATENPHISKDYLFELERKPKALRDALLYGHWDAFEGQVFVEWVNDEKHYRDRKFTHVIEPFVIPNEWAHYMSFDFGYSKPFSCCWWAVSPSGIAYLYKEWYGWNGEPNTGAKLSVRQITEGILEREQDEILNNVYIRRVADPAIFDESRGDSIARQMEPVSQFNGERSSGVFFEKGDNARLSGLAQFHERLRFDKNGLPKMQIFKTCKQFIRTIPSLPYSLRDVEDVDTDSEDHIFDAAKYFLMMSPLPVSVEERPRIKGYSPFN